MNKKLIPVIAIIIILSTSLFFIITLKDKNTKIVIVGGNFYPDIYTEKDNTTHGYLYELSKKNNGRFKSRI